MSKYLAIIDESLCEQLVFFEFKYQYVSLYHGVPELVITPTFMEPLVILEVLSACPF
jgi:hypothetical protein